MEDILLEMDRILRPEGTVILRDDVEVLLKVQRTVKGDAVEDAAGKP